MAALQQQSASPEEALVDKVLGAEQPTGRLYRGLITALRDDAETAEGLAAARKILKALAARAPALAEDRHARLWRALCDSISQGDGLLAERAFCLREVVSANATRVKDALDGIARAAAADADDVMRTGLAQCLADVVERCPQGRAEVTSSVRKAWPYVNAGEETHDGYTRFVIDALRCCDDKGPLLTTCVERALALDCAAAQQVFAMDEDEAKDAAADKVVSRLIAYVAKTCVSDTDAELLLAGDARAVPGDAAGANRAVRGLRRGRDDAHEGGGLLPDAVVPRERRGDGRRAADGGHRLPELVRLPRGRRRRGPRGVGVRDALRAVQTVPRALRGGRQAPRGAAARRRGARAALRLRLPRRGDFRKARLGRALRRGLRAEKLGRRVRYQSARGARRAAGLPRAAAGRVRAGGGAGAALPARAAAARVREARRDATEAADDGLFFPFDPCRLPRTKAAVAALFREWAAAEAEESSSSSSDDESGSSDDDAAPMSLATSLHEQDERLVSNRVFFFQTQTLAGADVGWEKGAGYSMRTTMTMIRNGVMTQQSCEQSGRPRRLLSVGILRKAAANPMPGPRRRTRARRTSSRIATELCPG